jgi:hypothetical protein
LKQYDELERAYKQLVDIEQRFNNEKMIHERCLRDNERELADLRQQLRSAKDTLDNDSQTKPTDSSMHDESKATIERLQHELQLAVSHRHVPVQSNVHR